MQRQIKIKFNPGVNPEPDSTEQDTAYCIAADNIRFYKGRIQKTGGHLAQSLSNDISGCPRTLLSFIADGAKWKLVGTHSRLYAVNGSTSTNITPFNATAVSLSTNPLDTVMSDATLTVNETAHGLAVGDRIKLSGATDVGGITAATYINKEHIIATVPNADSFTIELGTTAGSSASGGGSSVDLYVPIDAGECDAVPPEGWGVDGVTWGSFTWGDTPVGSGLVRPQIWSADLFGTTVIVCPGNLGKIYEWDPTASTPTETAPTVISNAPSQANWIFVDDAKLVALGAHNGSDQKDNRIKNSDTGDYTSWTISAGSSAYSDDKEDAYYLFSRLRVGDENIIFDESGRIFRLTFIGGEDKWIWQPVSDSHRLVGPNACIEVEGVGYFMGTDNFYYYNGGIIEAMPKCTLLRYVFTNINRDQGYKCTVEYIPQHQELRFYYPTVDSTENNRCVICNIGEGFVWYPRQIDRTATERTGHPLGGIYAIDSAGVLYEHEVGYNDDGAAMAAYARLAFSPAGNADRITIIQGIEPDAQITGTLETRLYTKKRPHNTEALVKTLSVTQSDGIKNCEKSARYWAWEFYQSEVDGFFQIGSYKEILTPGGYY